MHYLDIEERKKTWETCDLWWERCHRVPKCRKRYLNHVNLLLELESRFGSCNPWNIARKLFDDLIWRFRRVSHNDSEIYFPLQHHLSNRIWFVWSKTQMNCDYRLKRSAWYWRYWANRLTNSFKNLYKIIEIHELVSSVDDKRLYDLMVYFKQNHYIESNVYTSESFDALISWIKKWLGIKKEA